MKKFALVILGAALIPGLSLAKTKPKIHISFQWHMHQPIYWPYETVKQTQANARYSYDLNSIFSQRYGPYTDWPKNAIEQAKNAELPHAGAQVSFSGSLIENMTELYGNKWSSAYKQARSWKTSLGNPRLDMVGFGFHHPIMPLISYEDIRLQISTHRKIIADTFGSDSAPSKGLFPPENGFADWMIPALVDENIQWVFVDNIHFNRALQQYPWSKGENLFAPNPAEQRNPPLASNEWLALNGVWAPSKVSAWAERPHWIVSRDSRTGEVARTPDGKLAKMIAVPTERYLGNEDGRGGFGALNYEHVMSQFEPLNNDAEHPILLVLHHDGDNFGGGTSSYYHENFARFISWLEANPDRFEFTSVQDYVDRFPPAENDVVYVEPGSWSGADNGDPEFKKWFGDPVNDYSPDRNSWAVLIAAQNIMRQAEQMSLPAHVRAEALRYYLVAQTSCYEYWDGTEVWDGHPTRASNKVVELLAPYMGKGEDQIAPSILIPQREPYNPGGMEWESTAESRDFKVWTYIYDVFGLSNVTLHYRVQSGVKQPMTSSDYSKNSGKWNTLTMASAAIPSQTTPQPLKIAEEFVAEIKGVKDALVSYYVRAEDTAGNSSSSQLLHVYVGSGETEGSADITVEPAHPSRDQEITIRSKRAATLHWGVNNWTLPAPIYWPEGTKAWGDNKAVRSALVFDAKTKLYSIKIGPFNSTEQEVTNLTFTMNFQDGKWSPGDTKVEITK